MMPVTLRAPCAADCRPGPGDRKGRGNLSDFLAGLNAPGRPVGNLLFLGPTGSGKTRVVEAVAESLFGDARACIKIDCAEFQHSHEIAKPSARLLDTSATVRRILC